MKHQRAQTFLSIISSKNFSVSAPIIMIDTILQISCVFIFGCLIMYLFYKLREVTKQLDEYKKTNAHVEDLVTQLSASLKSIDGIKHQGPVGCNPEQVRDIVFSIITSENGVSAIRSHVYAQEAQDNKEILKIMMPPPNLFGAAPVDPNLMQAFFAANTMGPSGPPTSTITEITSEDDEAEDIHASQVLEDSEQVDEVPEKQEQPEVKEVSFEDIDFDQINKLASSIYSTKSTEL